MISGNAYCGWGSSLAIHHGTPLLIIQAEGGSLLDCLGHVLWMPRHRGPGTHCRKSLWVHNWNLCSLYYNHNFNNGVQSWICTHHYRSLDLYFQVRAAWNGSLHQSGVYWNTLAVIPYWCQLISPWTKWPPFYRRHFQMQTHFLE